MDIWQRPLEAFHGWNCLYSDNAVAFFPHVSACATCGKGSFLALSTGSTLQNSSSSSPGCSVFSWTRSFLLDLVSLMQTCTAVSDASFHQVSLWSFAFRTLQHEKLHQYFSMSTINWLWKFGMTSSIEEDAELLSRTKRKYSCQLPCNYSL